LTRESCASLGSVLSGFNLATLDIGNLATGALGALLGLRGNFGLSALQKLFVDFTEAPDADDFAALTSLRNLRELIILGGNFDVSIFDLILGSIKKIDKLAQLMVISSNAYVDAYHLMNQLRLIFLFMTEQTADILYWGR
jgi:hypothetical protein